jgi:formate dehydrogenase beta subunit
VAKRYSDIGIRVTPPCVDACPVNVDVPRYIRAVRHQKYDEALAVLREKLPFPTVCADACFAPCENVCAYKQFGDAIAIRALKRKAADKGGETWQKMRRIVVTTGKKVAVVGAGPTGLTAGYYLVSKGHHVTVFDAFPKPGGAIRYGIPNYRVSEERIEKDTMVILQRGVVFKGNTTIGKDISVSQLKNDFDAILLATGANVSRRIPLEGLEKKGVLWGLEFLRDVRLGRKFDFLGDVIVVGGGNVAIDVALTAKRLGADSVHLFCLEKREEMPAHSWEIDRAEEERVLINNSWAPNRILGDDTVKGIRLMKCLSVFDKGGKFNPVCDEEITLKTLGQHVILAVGQTADLSYLKGEKNFEIRGGRVEASEMDLSTAERGIFAGGDVVTGPDSIIGAIAQGRKAAAAIDRYLGGDGNIEESFTQPEEEVLLDEFNGEPKPRNDMRLLKPWERVSGFDQVELGLIDVEATVESGRCLNCDIRKFEVILNTEYCKECGYCEEVCQMGVFTPTALFNAKGYRPMEVKTSKWCCGCFRCYFACPDFAIDIKEVSP